MGCQASTETFKNCFKNLLVTFTLHTPDYHFTCDTSSITSITKKPQFSDGKLRGTTSPDLSTPFQLVCKHTKTVLSMSKRSDNIVRKKNYLKSAIQGLNPLFSCSG